ncbi:galactose oxidase, partial [Backusella circina FSU 941]
MSRQSASQSIAELITELYQTTGDIPPPLIGATTTLVNEYLYLFGGRLPKTKSVSNTLFRLHLPTKVWKHLDLESSSSTAPIPRYFHSASHYENYILFYGGMTISAETGELKTLDDLVFLDIDSLSWEYPSLSNVPPSRYAHVATLTNHRLVILGGQDIQHRYLTDIQIFDCKKRKWCQGIATEEQYGAYRSTAAASTPIRLMSFGPTAIDEALESQNNDDIAITIHCYSNHSSAADKNHQFSCFKLNTRNQLIKQDDLTEKCSSRQFSLPPLRFPTSFMCGQQMIIAGPHLSETVQQFHIWALDVNHFSWTRIEPGPVLSRGAWLHSALCHNSNRMLVFGHPGRSLTEDYRDRIHTFEYMACVDIEVFGIYKPPKMSYSASGQELGLKLLNDPILSDLRIITIDNQSMDVNSIVLAQRWPCVKHLLSPLINPTACSAEEITTNSNIKREFKFPDTHQVLVAFLQFIYTDHLLTAQQNQPHILARLLLIANLFEIPRLKELATHTLHQMLNMSTAPMIYESASLSNAVSLQIRALRVMIKARKMRQ